MNNKDYRYKEREVVKDPAREFRLGDGKISGVLSLVLGVLSLLAVFAYLYPSYLTTTDLRKVYDAGQLQTVLKYGMCFSLLFGILAFILNKAKYKYLGLIGITLTLIGFALGGYKIPVGAVEPKDLSLELIG